MELTILSFTLLCGVCYSLPSQYSHTIPVEGYETELENLGEHVEIPETPVKVIKITKTIAVKVPVPYPVKVRERVPYPVTVHKPYPVPVPQIIKVPQVPHVPTEHAHQPLDIKNGPFSFQNLPKFKGNSALHQSQEEPSDQSREHEEQFNSSKPNQAFDRQYFLQNQQYGTNNDHQPEDASEPFIAPVNNYYGYNGEDGIPYGNNS